MGWPRTLITAAGCVAFACTARTGFDDEAFTGPLGGDGAAPGDPFGTADGAGGADSAESPAPSTATANLLGNPGCEGGYSNGVITGWTTLSGGGFFGWKCDAELTPQSGSFHFFPDISAAGEIEQTIDVTSLATTIDAGGQAMHFEVWTATFTAQIDSSQITVTYLDAAGSAVGTPLDSGPRVSQEWERWFVPHLVPPGARRVAVRLTALRVDGSDNDGYADSFDLHGLDTTERVALLGF